MVLKGHSAAIMDVNWFKSGTQIVTVSADKTVATWDIEMGSRLKKLKVYISTIYFLICMYMYLHMRVYLISLLGGIG